MTTQIFLIALWLIFGFVDGVRSYLKPFYKDSRTFQFYWWCPVFLVVATICGPLPLIIRKLDS